MNAPKHIALVCNPTVNNRKALKVADSIAVLLRKKAVPYSVFTSYWPQCWSGLTDAWIIGGDGTLNYFINQFPNIQIPLSIFPGGSGNDFRWMLYGAVSVEAQVDAVLCGVPKKLDAGRCNGKLFLNGVGIGFDGAIVKDLFGQSKRLGKTSYFLSVIKNIAGYREKSCVIAFPNQTLEQPCFMINVANGKRYGGGFLVAPQALVNDALLDINIVAEISPLQRIRYLPAIEKGKHLHLPFISYTRTNTLAITCATELPAHRDGEFFWATHFELQVLPARFSFVY